MLENLQSLFAKDDVIREVRGRGLILGVEINNEKYDIKRLVNIMLQNGLAINASHGKTLRISPPLTITADLVEEGVDIIRQSILKYLLIENNNQNLKKI